MPVSRRARCRTSQNARAPLQTGTLPEANPAAGYTYIYIYIERERERGHVRNASLLLYAALHACATMGRNRDLENRHVLCATPSPLF